MGEQVLPALVQVTANLVQRWDILVWHAAESEASHVFRLLWLTGPHARVQMPVVSRADVHELPGQVRAAGAGSVCQRLGRVWQLGHGIHQLVCLLPRQFEIGTQVGNAHGLSPFRWNDPWTSIFREPKNVISESVSPAYGRQPVRSGSRWRTRRRIPPGAKPAKCNAGGRGDFAAPGS